MYGSAQVFSGRRIGKYPVEPVDQRKRTTGMSIVIAIRLENDDVLFAADKRIPTLSGGGYCTSAKEYGAKLVPAFGGMIGLTGNAELARSLIVSASDKLQRLPSLTGDIESLISTLLTNEYVAQIEPKLNMAMAYQDEGHIKTILDEERVAFIYAVRKEGGCRIVTYDLIPGMFNRNVCFDSFQKLIELESTQESVSVQVRGYQSHANMLLQWFNRDADKKTYSLLQAQRLAALMIAVTSGANPTMVNENIDMIRLSKDGPVQISQADILSIYTWVKKFIARTRRSFFGI